MKIHPVKFLYSLIILSGVIIKKLSAQIIHTDTSKLLALVPKKIVSLKTTIEEANVVFPESLEDHKDHVTEYVQKYAEKQRTYLINTYEKGKKIFPKVTTVLQRYELPEELKVLIALESGFNANAVSRAGAVGYWQIMDGVAREYGLHIATAKDKHTSKKDDRKNFNKSTTAAAKYFCDRKENFNNDILLMVASYNCGMGTVRNAIRKSGKADAGFWEIKKFLPKETRNYVMNFIALNVIFNNYEKFVAGQLTFYPKETYTIPFENPVTNPSVPAEGSQVD